ncbi:uncharacterized protein LOC122197884 [Lactuca sativa]|uniref:uncharacterized protein LOC122197884 n=1 Tax=Lactuca sativa TaxID=4236 RepID=UPI001C68A388|nr:uncharacterized protein LOC122197884 [Lactuca sativa]
MVQAQLAFCKFMVKPSIILVLDEPTNYLDIPSTEMLEIDFLNFDNEVDNDVEEPDEDLSDTEENRLVDDRLLQKYLQNIFNKEEENRRKALRMNSLLNGKTCKEASRMFFKTLGRVNMPLVQALLLTSQFTAGKKIKDDFLNTSVQDLGTAVDMQMQMVLMVGRSRRFGHLGLAVNFITFEDRFNLDEVTTLPKRQIILQLQVNPEHWTQTNCKDYTDALKKDADFSEKQAKLGDGD